MSFLLELRLFVACSKLLIPQNLKLISTGCLHSSPIWCRKKTPFYNSHIKRIRSEKVYTGFVNEMVEQHIDREESLSNDDPEYDLEEEIKRESIRRSRATRYSRLMRDLNKGAGPRLLTCDQMDHVRFLNQSSPDEWTVDLLAHSFQVPELVIRKVLRSKRVPNAQIREKLDTKARENQGLQRQQRLSPPVARLQQTAGLVPVKNSQVQQSWGLADTGHNGWFTDYKETKASSGYPISKRKENKMEDEGVEWMEEDDQEFMTYLMDSYEESEESGFDEDQQHEDDDTEDLSEEVEVDSDGRVFYLGEFLYKT